MSPIDALDARLESAGWTYSMVSHWRSLCRRGWSPLAAMRLVKAVRS